MYIILEARIPAPPLRNASSPASPIINQFCFFVSVFAFFRHCTSYYCFRVYSNFIMSINHLPPLIPPSTHPIGSVRQSNPSGTHLTHSSYSSHTHATQRKRNTSTLNPPISSRIWSYRTTYLHSTPIVPTTYL
ncbi:hypothetical protein HGRIS_004131 [Hohenbuehelia grisea]|uniref:Uncharacterized protein n=1 Tax=Hohenbuehelia grisea TaxID=104357 RepID=A0ABR3JID6_9AGAR